MFKLAMSGQISVPASQQDGARITNADAVVDVIAVSSYCCVATYTNPRYKQTYV